jgi:phosphocarrier protein HPr
MILIYEVEYMIQAKLTIQNLLGLHTRAAAKFVDTAKKFESRVEVGCRNRVVDGKSIMGLITLGAAKNQVIELIITGEDEVNALEAITQLVNDKFGEA